MENKNIFDFNEKDERKKEYHNFKENPEVMGILIKIDNIGNGQTYTLEFENKEILVGSYTALESKIHDSDIGKAIKIVYTGTEKSKTSKNYYMVFKVYIKDTK